MLLLILYLTRKLQLVLGTTQSLLQKINDKKSRKYFLENMGILSRCPFHIQTKWILTISYMAGTIVHETAIHGHILFFSSIACLAMSSKWFGLVMSRPVLSRTRFIAIWFQTMNWITYATIAIINELASLST